VALLFAAVITTSATPVVAGSPPVPPTVTPGTSSQIAALVAASTRIKVLPAATVPSLAAAATDNQATYEPSTMPSCTTPAQCVFGDTSSHHILVLLGDSHVATWIPALLPMARSLGLRIVLFWYPSCPAASVTIWYFKINGPYTACDSFRTASIAAIRSLQPELVMLGDSTTRKLSPTNPSKAITAAVWTAGLEKTIKVLRSPRTRVAVFEDITPLNLPPSQCLAANPSNVQSCGAPNPNPVVHSLQPAEAAAAKALRAPYIKTEQWLCDARCSPIVGKLIVYSDTDHFTYTYGEFLAKVVRAKVQTLL